MTVVLTTFDGPCSASEAYTVPDSTWTVTDKPVDRSPGDQSVRLSRRPTYIGTIVVRRCGLALPRPGSRRPQESTLVPPASWPVRL